MKCPALPRNTKTGQSALLRAAPCRWLSHHDSNRHRPLLPKDRSEQALAFGLFFSAGTLGRRCHLTRLLATSTVHDLV